MRQLANLLVIGCVTGIFLTDPARAENRGSVSSGETGNGAISAAGESGTHTLTIGVYVWGGSVTPETGTHVYPAGTVVTVTATPVSGQEFSYWSGSAVDAGKVADRYASSTTVTMDGDYQLWAHFAVAKVTLTISSTAGGGVTPWGNGVHEINLGNSISVEAVADEGYRFLYWSGTAVDAGMVANPNAPSTTVKMKGNYTLQANFEALCILTVSTNGGGTVLTPGEGRFVYDPGETVVLEVEAQPNYHFVGWSGSFSGASNPLSITMNGNCTVSAIFAPDEYILSISSGEGGSVVVPGQGAFKYRYGDTVSVMAVPDTGYRFAGWSSTDAPEGSIGDPNASRTYVTVTTDMTLQAAFAPVLSRLYVDDDAPGDPLPGNPTGSDPNENGTLEHPFDAIQEAIDAAGDGAAVLVKPGTYVETINFRGKSIMVSSLDPHKTGGLAQTIIHGANAGSVVTFETGENANTILAGLTITGGLAGEGGGVRCLGASPVIVNCIIAGNAANFGAGLHLNQGKVMIVNCTISDNLGTGLYCAGNAVVVNSILWSNQPRQIAVDSGAALSLMYCDVQEGWPGPGNINADPRFAAPGLWPSPDAWPPTPSLGDYHLKSRQGRWDPMPALWVQDVESSPCLDAGNPKQDPKAETPPNGGRVNCGAFGGTVEASLSEPVVLSY